MPKQEKIDSVADLKDRIASSSALYFVDFAKVTANDFNALRRKLGELNVRVRVVKNRLALRALTESGTPAEVEALLKGPTSIVFAAEDPIAPARTIRDAAKKNAALKVKGAYLDRAIYLADRFDFIAGLPTKHELRGQLVGVLEGPIWEFVLGLESLLNDLVYVLDQVKDRPMPATEPTAEIPAVASEGGPEAVPAAAS
jgi:large subunit ribosomal protein L10